MSKIIYVGRIPFDYTEEQLTDVFSSAGPVKETRLILDKATGQSKGFAFIEYYDTEAAASAVRNLNDHRLGNMRLRVNMSNEASNTFSGRGGNKGSGNNNNNQERGNGHQNNGPDANSGSAIGYVANLISDTPRDRKLAFLADVKKYTKDNRNEAFELLTAQPQLAYAIVQTMIDVGKIDVSHANTLVIENSPAPLDKGPSPSSRYSTPQPAGNSTQSSQDPVYHQQQAVPQHQIPPVRPTPPPQPQLMADESQRRMIRQLMALTPEQVNLLPPEQRVAAESLRARVQSGEIVL